LLLRDAAVLEYCGFVTGFVVELVVVIFVPVLGK